jgi:electron transfer flavoprotein alpha subunit
MSNVLVYVEHDDDGITDISLQCLAHGRAAATAHGAKLAAAVLGEGVSAIAEEAKNLGADLVFVADDASLKSYLPLPYSTVVAGIITDNGIAACLLPSSTVGNDLAPMVAAKLDAPCVLGVTEVAIEGGKHVLKRLEFDAKVKTCFTTTTDSVIIATLADGIAEPATAGAGAGEVQPVAIAISPDELKSVVERREVARKTVNLKDAKVIIGGGAGVGSAENFGLLEQLASKMGGEVGATRASVDAGWVSAERQIGQTGVNIKPDLYIAVGISGAVQHLVGIREAKTIIAINTDASAPIFKCAHYKIVGDLAEVLPKLIEMV